MIREKRSRQVQSALSSVTVGMTSDYARVERIIREYLERYLGGNKVGDAWTVTESRISGRGLRANRDLQSGDLIFWDRPLVLGPRRSGNPVCVVCHFESDELQQCPNGCKLPVCKPECAKSESHKNECTILAAHGSVEPDDNSWSNNLLRSVTALRCLQLDESDREVVRCLQANSDSYYIQEIDVIKQTLNGALTLEDEQWMGLCCQSMNTNAFEAQKRGSEDREGSLRGLYPLAALMNHECSPNTRHVYDDNCNMIAYAARSIPAGEEITSSYCSLLWDTSSRRLHLAKTKQFACTCDRCKDPTEYGTLLSALPCPLPPCCGVILCSNPLLPHRSHWTCNECSTDIQIEEVMKLQKIQGLLLMGTDSSNPESIINFLRLKRVPSNNVVEIQLKFGLLLQLGHIDGYKWKELTDDQLEIKNDLCKEILTLLEKLRTGECRLKGIITFERHCNLCEQLQRLKSDRRSETDEANKNKIVALTQEIKRTFQIASDIFEADATAPVKFFKKLAGDDLYKNYE